MTPPQPPISDYLLIIHKNKLKKYLKMAYLNLTSNQVAFTTLFLT